jgi:uncharacterized OB-fold protein
MTLLERDPNAPNAWIGDLPVTSRYTYGLAGERFFREVKENARILGTFCPDCDHTYVPAALYCERCLAELEQWLEVGNIGEVHTFTLLYQNYDGSVREEPEIVAFIKIADGGIVHRLGDISLDEIEIGMPVEAVFKPAEERQGSILDISHFRPR